MATQVKRRRGSTAQIAAFTPVAGEIIVDTTRSGLVTGDGVTAGGIMTPTGAEIQKGSVVYAAGSGTDTITMTLSPAPASYTAGMKVRWKQAGNNTGAATLNVNSLGAKAIKKNVADALEADDLVADGIYEATYDGTNFQLAGSSAVGGGGITLLQVNTATGAASDFTGVFNNTLYGRYLLIGRARPATDGVKPQLLYSVDGGSNYQTTSYAGYVSGDEVGGNGDAAWTSLGTSGDLLPGGSNPLQQGNDSTDFLDLNLDLGPLAAGLQHFLSGKLHYIGSESTGSPYIRSISRRWNGSTSAVNGLRFKYSSGNIASIRLALFGVAGA